MTAQDLHYLPALPARYIYVCIAVLHTNSLFASLYYLMNLSKLITKVAVGKSNPLMDRLLVINIFDYVLNISNNYIC